MMRLSVLWTAFVVALASGLCPAGEPGTAPAGLEGVFDLSRPKIELSEVRVVAPKDAAAALDLPKTEPVSGADWMEPDDRVVSVELNGVAVAAPLKVLERCRVVNMHMGEEPVAVVYDPACDAVTVVSRDVRVPSGAHELLRFGVSGAVYRGNMLLYDERTGALWGQLVMEAVTGPISGTRPRHYPVKVVPWSQFVRYFPDQSVLSRTDAAEPAIPGADEIWAGEPQPDERLDAGTPGMGVMDGFKAYFIPAGAVEMGGRMSLKTFRGRLEVARTEAGLEALNSPLNVSTAQADWRAWSATRPESEIVWGVIEAGDGDADNGGHP